MKKLLDLDGETIIHELVVVAFDMCSSSKLIEDLMRTENLRQYDRLLKNVHLGRWSNADKFGYAVYKFKTGDGWIVLFPAAAATGEKLMTFLTRLAKKFEEFRHTFVDKHLESVPDAVGLTFGLELGRVRKLLLGKEVEFVGRALNVACRLQTAVKAL